MEQLNLYQKLAKIRKPAEVVERNRRGASGTYSDLEAILPKITGLMDKYDVSLVPRIIPGTLVVEPLRYTKTKRDQQGKPYEEQVNEVSVRAEMEWVWIDNANPEDYIVCPWVFVATQRDASQAFGSALSYSRRYFLQNYFNMVTTDNDPEEYRRRQAEAEDLEDKLVAEKIADQIHELVTAYLAKAPDDRQKVMSIIKKRVKENGKPSANYYAIEKPEAATELLEALRKEFSKTNEEE